MLLYLMDKGDRTKSAILDRAVDLASVVGLHGLTIGSLAYHTGLSKSGLFAHFGSKETLQVETLKAGVERFTNSVIRPALEKPRGVDRVRALFDGWLSWSARTGPPGGCLFVMATIELDDQPSPVRDYLVQTQRDWLDLLETTARKAIETGAFRHGLDAAQFAHELHSIYLGFHMASRLLEDPRAEARARDAFDRLLTDACDGSLVS